MPTWTPRTLADEPGYEHNPEARCGYCTRKTRARMLVIADDQPSHLRKRGERAHCDACRERMFMTGVITREQYYRNLGAPSEIIEKMRRIDEQLTQGEIDRNAVLES